MNHFLFFYITISFMIGICALSVITMIAFKTHDKILKSFVFYFTSFSLVVVSNIIFEYINIITGKNFELIIILYILHNIFIFTLMFSIPFMTHKLLNIDKYKSLNLIFFIIALSAFIFKISCTGFDIKNQIIINLIEIPKLKIDMPSIIFILVNIYIIIIGFLFKKNIHDDFKKKLLLLNIISVMVFIPGLIFDFLILKSTYFLFHPLLYCLSAVIFLWYVAKTYLNNISFSKTFKINEDFLLKNNISPREKDVIQLILDGYSNHKISKELFVSLNTVKTHTKNIFSKLNINSRFELISFLRKNQ